MTRYMTRSKKEREFRECYALHYPAVLGYLVSKVGSIDDAEDICQEVFIRLYGNLEKVRDRRSWLMTAARFEITNYFNKKATARSDAGRVSEPGVALSGTRSGMISVNTLPRPSSL